MTVRSLRLATAALLLVACALLAGGCHSSEKTSGAPGSSAALNPPAGLGLQPVTLPDVSRMETSVRTQMEARFSSLRATVENRSSARGDLARAYGETGELLMAATLLDAAEVCFTNAQTLAPDDRRWPYFLGHIYKGKGPVEKSVSSFERARQLAPDDVAATVWLGDAYLAAGNPDAADRLFAGVIARLPSTAAARFGAGRAALAKRENQRAVDELTAALTLEPQATSIHYPLAMAYRALGNVAQSEAHLALQGKVDPRPPDPLMREIDVLLESPEVYNIRGGAELDAGHWEAAAKLFRKGLELAPNEPSLRQRYGTALYQMGDKQGAGQQFEEVLRYDARLCPRAFQSRRVVERRRPIPRGHRTISRRAEGRPALRRSAHPASRRAGENGASGRGGRAVCGRSADGSRQRGRGVRPRDGLCPPAPVRGGT